MTITTYRLFREAYDAGLRIAPAYHRDPATRELLDFVFDLTGPRPQDARQVVITDLESWLGTWLSDLYANHPGAGAQAADHAMRQALDRAST